MSLNAKSKTNLIAFPFPRLPGVQIAVKGLLLKIRSLGPFTQSLRTVRPCIRGSATANGGPSRSLPSARTRGPLIPLILHIITHRAAETQGIQILGTCPPRVGKAKRTHPHHPPPAFTSIVRALDPATRIPHRFRCHRTDGTPILRPC
jgi:hypothetical protein